MLIDFRCCQFDRDRSIPAYAYSLVLKIVRAAALHRWLLLVERSEFDGLIVNFPACRNVQMSALGLSIVVVLLSVVDLSNSVCDPALRQSTASGRQVSDPQFRPRRLHQAV